MLYTLMRDHRAGERKYGGVVHHTSASLWDLQTMLGPAVDDRPHEGEERQTDCLIVTGAYRIWDNFNPVTGDAKNPRGKFDQLFLLVGDGPDVRAHLLYHGQPGKGLGVRGRFVWRQPLEDLVFHDNEQLLIRLVLTEALEPSVAQEAFRKGSWRNKFMEVLLGELNRDRLAAPAASPQTASPAE